MSACSDTFHTEGSDGGEDPSSPTDKMAWWRDARFGMFIHWGVYSGLEGSYTGPNVQGNDIVFQTYGNLNTPEATQIGGGIGAEWILYEANIPRQNYKEYASRFTASAYDPEAIVALAKQAGMKYIILTAKHHEGFCLWKSNATEWNVSQSPAGSLWKNDVISPLAKAAKKAGLKFGLYFSEFRDWMHPGAPGLIPELNKTEYSPEEQQQYMETYTYPMIKDLLQRYNPDIFWWDGTDDNADFAYYCDSLVRTYGKKGILQNDRLSPETGYPGDFATPEQSMDESRVVENSELCMTLNGSWGYNRFDSNWKHPAYILYTLLRAEKLGCNLLLNIGPKADGSIPQESVEILQEIGKWMNKNEKAAHGTEKSPFSYNLRYGPTTYRSGKGNPHLYYHIFYWDQSGTIDLPGILNPADRVKVKFPDAPNLPLHVEEVEGMGLRVSGLPQEAPAELCSTLDIEFMEEPLLEEGIRPSGGSIWLDALGAQISDASIGSWSSRPDLLWFGGTPIRYKVCIPKESDYEISCELAAFFRGTITFRFSDGTSLTGNNTVTHGGHANFEWQRMGSVHLLPGTYELTISSQQENSWLRVRQFRMQEVSSAGETES